MKKLLGLLAGAALVCTALVPALSSPASAWDSQSPYTNYPGYTYYCFGLKATKTVPDTAAYDYISEYDGSRQHSPNYYSGTAGKDVIVTTDGADEIDNVSAGDVVCSLGGDDTINTTGDVNHTTHWNRIRIDAGQGNDGIFIDGDTHDWGSPTWVTLEAHTGPGDDFVEGGGGGDQIFSDGGTNTFISYCEDATAPTKVYVNKANSGTITPYYPASNCAYKTVKYPGYKGFTQLRPNSTTTTTRPALPVTTTTGPTTVTTIRSATTTTRPSTSTTVGLPVTTTTR
jgi:hypothetical protein